MQHNERPAAIQSPCQWRCLYPRVLIRKPALKNNNNKEGDHYMLKNYLFLAATVGLLASGCVKRSISQARYYGNSPQPFAAHGAPANAPEFEYRGELSEFDVLGISPGLTASETDI